MDIFKLTPTEGVDPEDDTYAIQLAQSVKVMRSIDPNYSRESVEDDSRGGNLHVAAEGDEVLGAAIFHITDPNRSTTGEPEGWLSYIATAPEHRGKGIGSAMVSYFGAICLERGVRSLNTIPSSDDSSRFFEQRNGFSPIKHPDFSGTIMRKTIK